MGDDFLSLIQSENQESYLKSMREKLISAIEKIDVKVEQNPLTHSLKKIYIPRGHLDALRISSPIVIGERGTGKSFWAKVLQEKKVRQLLARLVLRDEEGSVYQKMDVYTGFSLNMASKVYPTQKEMMEVFENYVDNSSVAGYLWESVAIKMACKALGKPFPAGSWCEVVGEIKSQYHTWKLVLAEWNESLEKQGKHALLIFSDLDRVHPVIRQRDNIIRCLLQFALEIQSFSHIHFKIFLLPELAGREVKNFPDSSKLFRDRSYLKWSERDLHSMLWHYLINSEEQSTGKWWQDFFKYWVIKAFQEKYGHQRQLLPLFQDCGSTVNYQSCIKAEPTEIWSVVISGGQSVYYLKDWFKADNDIQEMMFHLLTGPFMGKDRRRGYPYMWMITHLSDTHGSVSPRSFLCAIKKSISDMQENPSDAGYPIGPLNLQKGVEDASKDRVEGLKEDNPWVDIVMAPLFGKLLRLAKEDIFDAWKVKDIFGKLQAVNNTFLEKMKNEEQGSELLPLPVPRYLKDAQPQEEFFELLLQQLCEMGIFEEIRAGYYNMPNVYRIGFGLRRSEGRQKR